MGKFFNDKFVGYHTFGLKNDFCISRYGNFIDPNLKIADIETNLELIQSAQSYGWIEPESTELYYRDVMNITSEDLPGDNKWVPSDFTEFQYFTGVTEIPDDYFTGNNILREIILPNSVTTIGNRAFEGCSNMESVTIPNSVTTIGSEAFSRCSGLTSIEIPNSVTTIGEAAFWGCTGLTSVEIPNSVTSIGNRAFKECSNLVVIYVEPIIPPFLEADPKLGDYVVFQNTGNSPIVVPDGSYETYINTTGWSVYGSRIYGVTAYSNK